MNKRLISHARGRRALLAAASLACFGAALLLMPTDVRSQLDTRPREAATTAPAPQAPPPAAVLPQGDAFAPRVTVDDDRHPIAPPPPPPAPRAAAAIPVPRALAPARVTAIATGIVPTALVDDGGALRLVSAGEALEGSTIVTIDEDGVRLADGRRLLLEAAAAPR